MKKMSMGKVAAKPVKTEMAKAKPAKPFGKMVKAAVKKVTKPKKY